MNNKVNISVLSASPDFKVLSISGKSGDALKKHQVNYNALLLVRSGNIIYSEDTRQQRLTAGECFNIPADTVHEVTCIEESNFFVVLPNQTKMRFEK